jgi:hypothetical protein
MQQGKGRNIPKVAALSGLFIAKPAREGQRPPDAKPQSNHWTGEKSYCCFPEQLYLMSDVLA